MGVLILEKKEWFYKFDQLKEFANNADLKLRQERAARSSEAAEAKKREDALRNALDVEKECVANIKKEMHEMRAESVEAKVAAETKLTEARTLMEDTLRSSTEVQAKLNQAESLESEAQRFHRAVERKLREVEEREDDLRSGCLHLRLTMVQKEIQAETDRVTGNTKRISSLPINLSIYSPHEGQPESIVQEIEDMVRSYVKKPNCILLAITPGNQDIATFDAIKIAREVDPAGERTFGVFTKLDLMDKGTNALEVLEGSSYRLRHPWVGVVNRSHADINRNIDMIAARRREREFFTTSPDYRHLASRMGSEYLAKLLSKHLESKIKARIPGIMSLINKNVDELESELTKLGNPVAVDSQKFDEQSFNGIHSCLVV